MYLSLINCDELTKDFNIIIKNIINNIFKDIKSCEITSNNPSNLSLFEEIKNKCTILQDYKTCKINSNNSSDSLVIINLL